MTTAAICLPSAVNSKLETSVASTGVFVICRAWFAAMSVIQMCVAASVCTKYATALLSGDQVAFETRAPAGICSVFFEPSAAEMIWIPTLLRIVSARARFALEVDEDAAELVDTASRRSSSARGRRRFR